jgi:hypothetical protein
MVVEISTETLKEFGISANDYLYLHLLCNKGHDILVDLDLDVDLEDLQTKGFLKVGETVEDHVVREKFLTKHFTPFDQMWSELLSHFPLKVQDPKGSIRVLRSKDADSETNAIAKKKYKQYLSSNPNKHKQVIKALETELKIRKDGGNMHFMQMLRTWVHQKTWEQYIGLDAEPSSKGRITRQL